MRRSDGQVVALEKCLGYGTIEIKIECDHHFDFHVKQLFLRKRIVGHLNKVGDHGGVQFMEFAGNEHRCNSNKLEIRQCLDLLLV